MKLVHFADTHLGFRQYQRQTRIGANQREADVADAFTAAIAKTIAIAPELVVIAGDVFHQVRPGNPAVLVAHRGFSQLMESLPDTEVVVVAGNHDMPRTTDTGCLLPLFESLGMKVVVDRPVRLALRDGELSVLAVPDHFRPLPELRPDASAKYNVMVMHDQVEGIVNSFRSPRGDVEVDALNVREWDYIALGHYHVYHAVAPNAFYSGATEYTSTNTWQEVDKESQREDAERGKGIIEHDLTTGAHTFHRIASGRSIVDLPVIDGAGMSAAALSEAILAAAGDVDGKIVRQVVTGVPRHVVRDLDHRELRKVKARAFNYQLDTRIPENDPRVMFAPRQKRPPLADALREFLTTRELTPGIDRTAFVEAGMEYLTAAERRTEEKAGAVAE